MKSVRDQCFDPRPPSEAEAVRRLLLAGMAAKARKLDSSARCEPKGNEKENPP